MYNTRKFAGKISTHKFASKISSHTFAGWTVNTFVKIAQYLLTQTNTLRYPLSEQDSPCPTDEGAKGTVSSL